MTINNYDHLFASLMYISIVNFTIYNNQKNTISSSSGITFLLLFIARNIQEFNRTNFKSCSAIIRKDDEASKGEERRKENDDGGKENSNSRFT